MKPPNKEVQIIRQIPGVKSPKSKLKRLILTKETPQVAAHKIRDRFGDDWANQLREALSS